MGYECKIKFPGDAGWTDLSLLLNDEYTLDLGVLSDEFRHVRSTCSVKMVDDPTIRAKLLNSTGWIDFYLIKDGTRLFTGLLRSDVSTTVSNDLDYIALDAIDYTDLLDIEIPFLVGSSDWKLCSADTSKSYLHQLLSNVTARALTVSAGATPDTLGQIAFRHGSKLSDVLDQLCWEYGYQYYFDAMGEVQLVRWMASTSTTTYDFTSAADTVIDGTFQADKRDDPEDSAKVTWRLLEKRIDQNLGVKQFGQIKNAGTAFPDDPEWILSWSPPENTATDTALDDLTPLSITPTKIFHKAVIHTATLGNKLSEWETAIPGIGEYWWDKYPTVYGPLGIVTEKEKLSETEYKLRVTVAPPAPNSPLLTIDWIAFDKVGFLGDVWFTRYSPPVYQDGTREVRKEYESKHIHQKKYAEALAQGIRDNLLTSGVYYTFSSYVDRPVGESVAINLANKGFTTTGKILRKKYSWETREYTYQVKGLSAVTVPSTSYSPNLTETQPRIDGIDRGGNVTNPVQGEKLPDTSEIGDPLFSGLFMFKDKMGYYDHANGRWKNYFSREGTGYFSGKITAGDGLESDNFSPGVSGWRITGDGDAEFRDLTARGVFEAIQGSKLGVLNVGADGSLSVPSGSFAINGTTGDAEFKGTVKAGSVLAGTIQADNAIITNATGKTLTFQAGSVGGIIMEGGTLRGNTILANNAEIKTLTGETATISGIQFNNNSITNGNLFELNKDGEVIAKAGTIAGWNIKVDRLYSGDAAGTGRRIELNKPKNRVSVFDSSGSEVVSQGYLEGLANPAGGVFGAGDYGFWIKAGEKLSFYGGSVDFATSPVVKHGQAIHLRNSADTISILKFGDNGTGMIGFHAYDSGGVHRLSLTAGGIDTHGRYLRYPNAGLPNSAINIRMGSGNDGQYFIGEAGGIGVVDSGWTNTTYLTNNGTYNQIYNNTGNPIHFQGPNGGKVTVGGSVYGSALLSVNSQTANLGSIAWGNSGYTTGYTYGDSGGIGVATADNAINYKELVYLRRHATDHHIGFYTNGNLAVTLRNYSNRAIFRYSSPVTGYTFDVDNTTEGFIVNSPAGGNSAIAVYSSGQGKLYGWWDNTNLASAIGPGSSNNSWYFKNDRVGFGTADPQYLLHLKSANKTFGNAWMVFEDTTNKVGQIGLKNTYGADQGRWTRIGNWQGAVTYISTGVNYQNGTWASDNTNGLVLSIGNTNFDILYFTGSTYTSPFTVVGSSGRVGINKSSPSYNLDVNGTIYSQTILADRFNGIRYKGHDTFGTQGAAYTALSPFLPVNGDCMQLSGSNGGTGGPYYPIYAATRINSTTIRIYFAYGSALDCVSGSTSGINIAICW